jgi:DNA-binding NarL/FixJ family response regulator
VDDHTVIREGLRAMLSSHPDLQIIGEAASGQEAVALVRQAHPDVVLMDIAMPHLNGLEATRQILKAAPATKVLVLTSYSDEECVERLMKAGAAGYLVKHTAANELPQAIREVRRGNAFFSPAIAKHLRQQAQAALNRDRYGEDDTQLTARELEVLQLVAEGYSNREAADKLNISIKTIEKHRQQVMNKLNIHEVAGLTRYAIAQGIVPKASPVAAPAVAEPQFLASQPG